MSLLSRMLHRAGYLIPSAGAGEPASLPSNLDEASPASTPAPATAAWQVTPLSEHVVEQAQVLERMLNTQPLVTAEQMRQAPVNWITEEEAARDFYTMPWPPGEDPPTPVLPPYPVNPPVVLPPPGVAGLQGYQYFDERGPAPTYLGIDRATTGQWRTRMTGTAWTTDETVAIPNHAPVLHSNVECIPRDHPVVQHILSLVPERLRAAIWLGGSATTCFGQHGDVDAWIGWLDREPTLEENRLMAQVKRAVGNMRDHQEGEIEEEYDNQTSHMLYMGEAPDGTHIHILGAILPMQDVLEAFDISTHARIVHIGNSEHPIAFFATGYTERPTVHIRSWHSAKRTLERGIKFAKRYDDERFWHSVKTRECAAAAFGVRIVPPEIVERMELLGVSEGL